MNKKVTLTMKYLASLFLGVSILYGSAQNLSDLVPPIFGGDDEAEAEAEVVAFEELDDKFVLNGAPINTIFQYLSEEAGMQYFHNSSLASPQYNVTGHLNIGEPIAQMEELAFMYDINIVQKGKTLYAFTDAQVDNKIETEAWHYQLRYLRPEDIADVINLIRPYLSDPAGGKSVVNFEKKTNTLIIMDRKTNLDKIKTFLGKIDKPKKQIAVEVKILRVDSDKNKFRGVDWSQTLGEAGLSLGATQSLTDLFNLDSDETSFTSTSTIGSLIETNDNAGFVLTPVQIEGVLRALDDQNLSQQLSSPTIITEDNESAAISLIDRIPIITSTSTPNVGGETIVSEEVRYTVDESDPTIVDGADQTREIGITISVTPVTLPDGTIRMKLRPRTAQVTGEVAAQTVAGFPEVTEAMVESIARVPNGHSLILGGFYENTLSNDSNEVPLLSKIPLLNFFFKSEAKSESDTSLVFIVTPRVYDPANLASNDHMFDEVYDDLIFDRAQNIVENNTKYPEEVKPNRGTRAVRNGEGYSAKRGYARKRP